MTPRTRALVEDFLDLTAQGETHPEMLRQRLGSISPRTLERVKAAAKDYLPADGWADVSGPAVRCPVCQSWSPDLPDHHAAADWRDNHECQPITERKAA